MSVIHLLDKSVADLIAAGEVVERPASAVKELVENAIDAKANRIHVEIERGGISMIKVSDNGIGMSEEDAKKAFLKHSTSKIATKDDLFSIHTLGFRGEALCSIAAVSTVTMKTKTEEADSGFMIQLKAGKILNETPTAYPRGTEITVERLFENTPARFKFLKPEAAETTVITTLIENLAVSHPEISFLLTVNGKERIRTYGNNNLKETVFSVFGRDFSDSVLPLSFSEKRGRSTVEISGFAGKPLFTRGNRTKQLFYVNGRYIKSPAMSRALENAYRNSLLAGRFPVCVIFIQLPPSEVDVNVHPGKTEVKFSDESFVYDAVASAVLAALKQDRIQNEFVPKSDFSVIPPKQESKQKSTVSPHASYSNMNSNQGKKIPESIPSSERKEIVQKILSTCISEKKEPASQTIDYGDWKIDFPNPANEPVIESAKPFETPAQNILFSDVRRPTSSPKPKEKDKPMNPPQENLRPEPQEKTSDEKPLLEAKPAIRIVGEIFHSYIVVEKDDEIIFIDKHALHERMNFERLKTRPRASKMLLTPVICALEGDKYASVLQRLSLLNELGFSAEDFGEGTVIIREIPEMLSPEDIEPFLDDFAGTETRDKNLANSELFDHFLYDIACKASIKAGKISSEQEIEALVNDYFDRENQLKYCPHGRPILFTMNRKNIEKQFKRIL